MVSYHDPALSSSLSPSSSSEAISERDSSLGRPSSRCWRRRFSNASRSWIFLLCHVFAASFSFFS
jgi:hypothetical protein